MQKISIKREQSQAGLSFAERENRRSLAGGESNFRPQVKNKLLLLLVLLVAVATGAWAQTETLLTTITATGITPTGGAAYDETATTEVVTVTLSDVGWYSEDYGWCWYQSGSLTVEAKEGYTITKCVFKQINKTPITINTSPFTITFANDGKCEQSNDDLDGINSIEVYGYVAPTGYSITLDEGTGNKDSQNWEITPKSSELSGNEAVTVKYNGSREVKSVTVVKKAAAPVDNTYQTWDGTQKKLVEAKIPAEVTKVENANAGVTWSAGTYVVEGEDVKINGTITLNGDVNLIIKDGAKLTANKIAGGSNNLSIYGQAQMTGELVINGSVGDAINDMPTLEVHSAKVTATTSTNASAGIGEIKTFNVYGGLVDAKATVATSCGIHLTAMGSSMNIYGGEVKAEGTGDGDFWGYGIVYDFVGKAPVTVYGGKLWAGNANNKALNGVTLAIDKSLGFNGEIEESADNSNWNPTVGTPDAEYVRVGY